MVSHSDTPSTLGALSVSRTSSISSIPGPPKRPQIREFYFILTPSLSTKPYFTKASHHIPDRGDMSNFCDIFKDTFAVIFNFLKNLIKISNLHAT